MKKILLTFLSLWIIGFASAQNSGDLYQDFGTFGISIFEYMGLDQVAWDMAVLDNDKIIVVGKNDQDVLVLRFLNDGNLDETFGEFGKRIIDLGYSEIATSVNIDSNGDILIGGLLGWEDCFILKLNADGSLAEEFGDDGVVKIFEHISAAEDMIVLEDNTILIAGWELVGDLVMGAIMKYSSDGSVFEDFGENGYVHLDYSDEGISVDFQKIAVTHDHNILVSGRSTAEYEHIIVASYNENGYKNESFGSGGVELYGDPEDDTYLGSMLLDTEGRIVFGSDFTPGSSDVDRDLLFFRLLPNGDVDDSFNGGELIIDLGNTATEFISSMVLEEDGKYIAGGAANNDFMLIRINEDGSVDESFGDDGIVQTNIYNGEDVVYSLAFQSDMNIIAGGKAFFVPDGDYDVALTKYYSGLFVGEQEHSIEKYWFSAFPNPAKDHFMIRFNNEVKGEVTIELFNLNGKKVFETTTNSVFSEIEINNLNLNIGCYFIKATHNKHSYSKKILIK